MVEAGAVAALPEELMNDIKAWTDDKIEYYMTKRSEEDQAKDDARQKEWMTNEEYKAGIMKQLTDAFTAADSNNDGLLSTEEEFKAFQDVLLEQARERGSFVDDREDNFKKFFVLCTRVNPETEGLSMQDFFAVMKESQALALIKKTEISLKKQYAASVPDLSEDIIKDIQAWTYERAVYKAQTWTLAQKESDLKRLDEFRKNPEMQATIMKGIEDAFNDADSNKDGQLATDEEFRAFQKTLEEQARARGSFVDDRQEGLINWFKITTRINPDTEGMSMKDFYTVMKVSQPYLLSIWPSVEAKYPLKA